MQYYIEKKAGFYRPNKEDELKDIFYYQPTPEGVMVLCEHYSKKYQVDLECVDLRDQVERADNAYCFFKYLQENATLLDVKDGQSKGLLLSHGQYHAIPVLVRRDNGHHHIIVFDSSSGARIKGYFKMASLFPASKFYLNAGTRQADEGSCITDAICILKEALQMPGIIDDIEDGNIPEHDALKPNRFCNTTPDNFYIFSMPVRLLLTAQTSKYVNDTNADQDSIIRGGQSLKHYRELFSMDVILSKNEDITPTKINGYLYVKSLEHWNILDQHSRPKLAALDDGENAELAAADDRKRSPTAARISPDRISLSPSKFSFASIDASSEDSRLNTPNHNAKHLSISR